jgi:hypothetical protein
VSGTAVSTSSAALAERHAVEPSDDLAGLALSSGQVFLGVDRLEHQRHLAQLAGGDMAEDVAVEMHHTALPAGFGKELGGTLDQAHAGIGDDQRHPSGRDP